MIQQVKSKWEEEDDSRRSKIGILVDILRLIQKKGGVAKPTHILYGANLSHVRLNKYMDVLMEKQFVETVNAGGRGVYKITDKGMEFVREFRKVEQFSEAFGVPI